jgi:hypothetical protein
MRDSEMKTVLLLVLTVAATCSTIAGTASTSELNYLVANISDSASRERIRSCLTQNELDFAGLPQRANIQFPAGTVASSDGQAWEQVRPIVIGCKLVTDATHAIEPVQRKLDAERGFACLLGLAAAADRERRSIARQLIGLHHRELSREVLWHCGRNIWEPTSNTGTTPHRAEQSVFELFEIRDSLMLADVICRKLNDYDIASMFSSDRDPILDEYAANLARSMCAALDTKYSSPLWGWNAERLRRFAIRQLRRAAKRTDLAPADAGAIATALDELETFQPDPLNKLSL